MTAVSITSELVPLISRGIVTSLRIRPIRTMMSVLQRFAKVEVRGRARANSIPMILPSTGSVDYLLCQITVPSETRLVPLSMSIAILDRKYLMV